MVNLIEWHRVHLPSAGCRVLQFAALSFDVCFQETFSTLCGGGTLVLLDECVRRDARAVAQLLRDQAVDRLFVPPLMLQALAQCFKATGMAPRSLKDIITAGEQLHITPDVVALFEHLRGCRLHNHYGPTETHVVTALTLAEAPGSWPAFPSIGRPIANTQMYILNERQQPAPIGVPGEIYIGGANVARGYLHHTELTHSRFLKNPFSADPAARLYRTGDLGCWQPDGSIEYLGRNDQQVKVRGYRIELGEIEAQLVRHHDVREAAVEAREVAAGDRRLIAYVSLRAQSACGAELLRAHLRTTLPEHMVPSAIVVLDRLPVTPSGKVDRRALPSPPIDAYFTSQYDPPQGEVEQTLARIWQELLQLERVGREDDFFDLGGHSLHAVQVMSRIQASFSVDLPIRQMFAHSRLKELASCVSELRRAWLLERVATGGADIDELLEEVASMPEAAARELRWRLTAGDPR
jgi:acyl-coenzyme A synthetase/AMP-(fatty) acid ligase/acyl carrier protein